MYRRLYPWVFVLVGVVLGMLLSGRMILHAQNGGQPPAVEETKPRAAQAAAPSGTQPTVQEVLARPYHFPFEKPTTLAQVCLHLKQTLGIRVVMDIAALGRQDVKPEDTVQLELDGVRLKTGLKLLLEQVGLTYQVVADDNLLIVTDREGSDDPLDRIWTELKALHRDLHDVQDAVDDIADAVYGEEGEGPRVRKPTIIEEKPDPAAGDEKKESTAPAQDPAKPRPRARPGALRPPGATPADRPPHRRVPV